MNRHCQVELNVNLSDYSNRPSDTRYTKGNLADLHFGSELASGPAFGVARAAP